MEPPKKHKNAIPSNLVFYINKKQNSHLSPAIGNLIEGDFLFGMRSYKYSTIPKGENKKTCILWKGDIRFYWKRRDILHSSGCINLEEKVYPTSRTQKNGFKNATLNQWQTGKHL